MNSSPNESLAGTGPSAQPTLEASGGVLYLPPTFLDALIPGWSVLAKVLLDFAGIDISFYASLCALAFILHAAWNFTIAPLTGLVLKHITSRIYIEEHDDLFDQMFSWIRTHKLMKDLRELKAESQGRHYDYDDEDDDNMELGAGAGAIFNFNDWAARAAPAYEPNESSGYFLHKGYLFKLTRNREKMGDGYGSVRECQKLIITVLWRSTVPIKALIEECRESYLASRTSRTRIYRPVAREARSANNEWHVVSSRPSRPMSTVVLDDEPKAQILLDMNEFLTPDTVKWYANRGIPYRRGYLFHGPPGTGKSSMSFSLAGLFGLSIYCLSLSDVTLTEEALIVLFNSLPTRCLVLLEDIDSAGISRPKPPSDESSSRRSKKRKPKKKAADSSSSGDEIPMGPGAPKKLTNAISISGLLNAIDGVASPEGRILIMTTNHPERLDHALVRPGRVDLQIKFDLASTMQIKELFLRMYSADSSESDKQPTCIQDVMPHMDLDALMKRDLDDEVPVRMSSSEEVADIQPSKDDKDGTTASVSAEKLKINTINADLEALADKFAKELPDNTFSPAEIQGYLLMRKNQPKRAVKEVVAFREELLAKRKLVKEESAKVPKSPKIVEKDKVNEISGTEEKVQVVNGDEPVGEHTEVTPEKDKKETSKAKKVSGSDGSETDSDSGSGSDSGSDSESD